MVWCTSPLGKLHPLNTHHVSVKTCWLFWSVRCTWKHCLVCAWWGKGNKNQDKDRSWAPVCIIFSLKEANLFHAIYQGQKANQPEGAGLKEIIFHIQVHKADCSEECLEHERQLNSVNRFRIPGIEMIYPEWFHRSTAMQREWWGQLCIDSLIHSLITASSRHGPHEDGGSSYPKRHYARGISVAPQRRWVQRAPVAAGRSAERKVARFSAHHPSFVSKLS